MVMKQYVTNSPYPLKKKSISGIIRCNSTHTTMNNKKFDFKEEMEVQAKFEREQGIIGEHIAQYDDATYEAVETDYTTQS